MLQRAGYAVETHAVTTEDGYVLEMHRIPRSMTGQQPTRNHPVFVHHGIIGSSADWIFGGPSKSLRECCIYNIIVVIVIRYE